MTDRKRRQFLRHCGGLGALALAPVPWLSGCDNRAESLVIATNPWIGYETLYLARDLNWLPQGVELRDLKTATSSLAALENGEANAACLTLDEMLRGRDRGLPLSIAMVFDSSAGGDVVLARQDIKVPADLAGKRIGYERSGVGALVFSRLLAAAKLPRSAVVEVDLPPMAQLDAWHRNAVDAVITYEPEATLIRRAGGKNIFDSRLMPDMIFDTLVIHRDRAPSRTLIRAAVKAHFRGLQHLRTSIDDALFRIAGRRDLHPDDVNAALQGLSQPTLAANHSLLIGEDNRLMIAARKLSSLMTEERLLKTPDTLSALVMPETLPDDDEGVAQ